MHMLACLILPTKGRASRCSGLRFVINRGFCYSYITPRVFLLTQKQSCGIMIHVKGKCLKNFIRRNES